MTKKPKGKSQDASSLAKSNVVHMKKTAAKVITPVNPPETPKEDQNDTPVVAPETVVVEEPTVEVAADVPVQPKKIKRRSKAVSDWKEQVNFKPEQVITVLVSVERKPKRDKALLRYAYYKTGMTVQQYIDKMKEKFNTTPNMTHGDIRWDYIKKFIDVK
jgi:hypothetical protein